MELPNDPTVRVSETTTRTPFVKHFAEDGEVFSCIYADDRHTALIALFCEPGLLDRARAVPVRLHSSCSNSDILETFDCDCRSQLVRSLAVLRARKGVLIHIFQEGRGAGIFGKYLGMYTMQARALSTYGAYRHLSFPIDSRTYAIAAAVLRDLEISSIALLSNNPKKARAFAEAGFTVSTESLLGQLTPQNFSYLFTKFTEGEHVIPDLFPADGDYFFCETITSRKVFPRTWIFDGDDTLWEDNVVYDRLATAFVEHWQQHVPMLIAADIRRLIDDTEERLIPSHGFGAPGFRQSLQVVHQELCAAHGAIAEPSALFDSVVSTLSNQPQEMTPGAMEVLTKLATRGDRLVLFTQGPSRIQFEKIARSGLAELFHAICVVTFKDADTLHRLMTDCGCSPGESVVVGNSLRSDIAPALSARLNAVHYKNPNTWHVQNRVDLDVARYRRVDTLKELLDMQF